MHGALHSRIAHSSSMVLFDDRHSERRAHVGSTWENWWLHVRMLVAAKDRRKFDTLIILVAWTLWKHRNAVVFGNTRDQCSPTQLADRVRDEFRLWELAGFGGSRSQEGE
jgi:hypothetical protein